MTDPYAELRVAIEDDVRWWLGGGFSYATEEWTKAASPDVIRALLAERDKLAHQVEILSGWAIDAGKDAAEPTV